MVNMKQINIKNRTYNVFNDMINIKKILIQIQTKSHIKILIFITLDISQ